MCLKNYNEERQCFQSIDVISVLVGPACSDCSGPTSGKQPQHGN